MPSDEDILKQLKQDYRITFSSKEGERVLADIQSAYYHRGSYSKNDPHETINLANNPNYTSVLSEHQKILNNWINETDDKGQYPESDVGLRCVLQRWDDQCINPEYTKLKNQI